MLRLAVLLTLIGATFANRVSLDGIVDNVEVGQHDQEQDEELSRDAIVENQLRYEEEQTCKVSTGSPMKAPILTEISSEEGSESKQSSSAWALASSFLKDMFTLRIPDMVLRNLGEWAHTSAKPDVIRVFKPLVEKGQLTKFLVTLEKLVVQDEEGGNKLEEMKEGLNTVLAKAAEPKESDGDLFVNFDPPITIRLRDGSTLNPTSKFKIGHAENTGPIVQPAENTMIHKAMNAMVKNIFTVLKAEKKEATNTWPCVTCWFSKEFRNMKTDGSFPLGAGRLKNLKSNVNGYAKGVSFAQKYAMGLFYDNYFRKEVFKAVTKDLTGKSAKKVHVMAAEYGFDLVKAFAKKRGKELQTHAERNNQQVFLAKVKEARASGHVLPELSALIDRSRHIEGLEGAEKDAAFGTFVDSLPIAVGAILEHPHILTSLLAPLEDFVDYLVTQNKACEDHGDACSEHSDRCEEILVKPKCKPTATKPCEKKCITKGLTVTDSLLQQSEETDSTEKDEEVVRPLISPRFSRVQNNQATVMEPSDPTDLLFPPQQLDMLECASSKFTRTVLTQVREEMGLTEKRPRDRSSGDGCCESCCDGISTTCAQTDIFQMLLCFWACQILSG